MDVDKKNQLAAYLFKVFNSENIIPSEVTAALFKMMPSFDPAFSSEVLKEWKRITDAYKKGGKNPRDINSPLIITRGFMEGVSDSSLKLYLPEEKILINRQVFRNKISSVNFASLSPETERRILEELKNESIALSDQEVVIYYNLLKINVMAKLYSSAQSAVRPQSDPPVSGDSSGLKTIGEGGVSFPEKIISLLFENFADINKVMSVNEKRSIDNNLLVNAVKSKISKSVHNPRIYLLMFGYGTDKYMQFVKDYIKMVVSRWGGKEDEIFAFFTAYQLLNSASDNIIDELDLAVSLKNFISDKLGRIHPVYYCAILFVTVFTYILVMQVVEVSGKYVSSPEPQKAKLLKLYNSEERINMIISNAFNIAAGKIASYKSESREIIPNMKKFISKNENLVKAEDMFRTIYKFQ